MKHPSALILAAVVASAALILSPETLVRDFLPERYASYHDRLVLGLWLTRYCLVINAILLVALPLIQEKLFIAQPQRREAEAPPVYTRDDLIAVVLLTLAALGLRAYRLSSGYSADEITVSMSMVERPLPQLMIRAEPHRLLPAVLDHFLYRFFGVSEIAGRLPSLISGAASIPLIYILARRWTSARCATATAAFLALSTFHVWYSQLLTSYALALFFILLSMILFEECLRDPRPRSWYWWGGSTLLAIVSHFQLALFVVFAHGVRLGWRVAAGLDDSAQLGRFSVIVIWCAALAATIFAPNFFVWSSIITGLTGSSDPHFVAVEPRGTVPGQALLFAQWLCNQYSPWSFQVVAGCAAVIGGGLFAGRKPWLALYLMLPTLVLWFLFSVGVIRRITPRHSIFTLIPMSLFVGSAIADVIGLAARSRWHGWRKAARAGLALGLTACFLANASVSLRNYYAVDRFPFKAAASFLASRVPKNEPVYGLGYGYVEFRYYFPGVERVEDAEQVGRLLDAREPAWFVGLGTGFVRHLPEALRERFLEETSLVFAHYGRPEHYLDPNDGFVYRYDPRR